MLSSSEKILHYHHQIRRHPYLQLSRNDDMRSLAASSPACIDICWKPDLGEEDGNVVVVVVVGDG